MDGIAGKRRSGSAANLSPGTKRPADTRPEHQRVGALHAAVGNEVGAVARVEHIAVATVACVQHVVAGAADQDVRLAAAVQAVVAGSAIQQVLKPRTANKYIGIPGSRLSGLKLPAIAK